MAAVIDVDRLRGLLAEAACQGCRLVWIDDGSLMAGAAVGRARYEVSLALERVVPLQGRSPATRAGEAERRSAGRGSVGSSRREVDPHVAVSAGRRTGNFALVLDGKVAVAKSQRDLLVTALAEIERVRPGSLETLSHEKARTKRPVARRRELLYGDARLARFAEQIEGGWWVATNNSFPEVEKVIRRAAFHAGLEVEIRRAP